jgi:hypothetical protein
LPHVLETLHGAVLRGFFIPCRCAYIVTTRHFSRVAADRDAEIARHAVDGQQVAAPLATRDQNASRLQFWVDFYSFNIPRQSSSSDLRASIRASIPSRRTSKSLDVSKALREYNAL